MCASLSALFIGLVPKLFVYVYVCIKHLFGVFDILKHDNYCQALGNKIVNFLILDKILLQAFSSLQLRERERLEQVKRIENLEL